jgi:hypothetical protein
MTWELAQRIAKERFISFKLLSLTNWNKVKSFCSTWINLIPSLTCTQTSKLLMGRSGLLTQSQHQMSSVSRLEASSLTKYCQFQPMILSGLRPTAVQRIH